MSPNQKSVYKLNNLDDVLSESLKRREEIEQEKLHNHIRTLKLDLVYGTKLSKKAKKALKMRKAANQSNKNFRKIESISRTFNFPKTVSMSKNFPKSDSNLSRLPTNMLLGSSIMERFEKKCPGLALGKPNFIRMQVLI